MKAAAAAGLAISAATFLLLPFALAHFTRPSLGIHIPPGPIILTDAQPTLRAELPEAVEHIDGLPTPPPHFTPGLHRFDWQVTYRGGFQARVGATALAGPFQDPAHPRCGLHFYLGQRFLDDTLVPLARAALDENLRGFGHWTIGDFHYVSRLSMTWRSLLPILPPHLEIALSLTFNRAEVPIWIIVVPVIRDGKLALVPSAFAMANLDSAFLRVSAKALSLLHIFDKDQEATNEVRAQLGPLVHVIESLTLPEIPLSATDGGPLTLHWCAGEPIEIVEHSYASLPLYLDAPRSPNAIPPAAIHLALGPSHALPPDEPLAVDVDLDTINAILHRLWARGTLDRLLAANTQAFNLDETVRRFLSLRIASAHFTLPPTIQPQSAGRPLAIAAEVGLTLTDGTAAPIPARLFGRIGFELKNVHDRLVAELTPEELAADLDASVVLSCEREPNRLTPCFSEVLTALLAAIRMHKDRVHTQATAQLAAIFDAIVRGYSFDVMGHKITVAPWHAATTLSGGSARVRVELSSTVH